MPSRSSDGTFLTPAVPRKDDERTGIQAPDRNMRFWGEGMFYGNGGSVENPLAFPGYDALYTGTYGTYRWMLQHPILRLVRAIATGAVIASTWEYEADEGINKSWVDAVERNFDKLRPDLMDDFYVRGRDYGWAGGEPIWDYDAESGLYGISRVKPLIQDHTDVLRDTHGNFIGLRNNIPLGTTGTMPDPLSSPYKAWKYTYDGEAGYPYGRAWLENVRGTAWRQWLDCAQQLARLGAKISGVSTIIKSPAGTFPGAPDANGRPTTVSYQKNAETAIKALASGAAGVWFPSLGILPDAKGNLDAMKVLVELAGKSLTTIDVVDHSGNATAIAPILAQMIHAEELMFAGGLRSSRTGLQGQHGTKEEAGTHSETGMANAEAEDSSFARQCQPLVDAYVSVNFSPRAVGKIRIKPPSLVDKKTATLKAMLLALVNIPEIAVEIAAAGDIDRWLDAIDVTRKGAFDVEKVRKAIADKAKPKEQSATTKNPEPQGGRPKKLK